MMRFFLFLLNLLTLGTWGRYQRRVAAREHDRGLNFIVTSLISLPENIKQGELQLMKLRNPSLHALIVAELVKLRETANGKKQLAREALIEAMCSGEPGVIKNVDGVPTYVKCHNGYGAITIGVNVTDVPLRPRLGCGRLVEDHSKFGDEIFAATGNRPRVESYL